jgi:hypothetical protein
MEQELELLDLAQDQIDRLEECILHRIHITETIQLAKTLLGVGTILSIVIEREVGAIDRFPSHRHLASYSATVPKVTASGGKFRYGKMRTSSRCSHGEQSNQYPKWAFRAAPRRASKQPISLCASAIANPGAEEKSRTETPSTDQNLLQVLWAIAL